MKLCTQCGCEKPESEYYQKTPTRLHARCKACMNEFRRNRYVVTKHRELAVNAKHYAENADKYRAAHRAYGEAHRQERSLRSSERRHGQQRAHVLALERQYRDRNRDRISAYMRERWRDDLEESRRAAREYYRSSDKASWMLANHRRRLLCASGTLTPKEWREVLNTFGNKCLRCGKDGSEAKITLDHVLPLAMGGGHTKDNVQPLCSTCNRWKWTQHIDFRTSRVQVES